jgi:acetylornithine deacetylase/succinyl-diaminopimelate desuccinylase-like protein
MPVAAFFTSKAARLWSIVRPKFNKESEMPDLMPVLARADQNLPSSLDQLFELLRIKSISTDPAYKGDCRKAAVWLVDYLKTLGFDASVRDTPGHPMVVAHHDGASASAPHVLFYGHYDVQPVDPIELWDNDPFEPLVRKPLAARSSPAAAPPTTRAS